MLTEAEVRPHRVRGWLRRADDPAFWTRAGEVCRFCLDPPAGPVLVSIDEKTGIGAKTRKCSREDLEAHITEFTVRHNETARPYRWSYNADTEHARYLERHPHPNASPTRAT